MSDQIKAAFDALARYYDSRGEWPLPPRGPMSGPNARALRAWIAENMPELSAELGPLPLTRVRERLNEITGCAVHETEPVERSCLVFLDQLQTQQNPEKAP